MNTIVNGASRELAGELSLLGLLRELAVEPDTVAVEHNGEIVAGADLGGVMLREGDRVEIVRFVGGG